MIMINVFLSDCPSSRQKTIVAFLCFPLDLPSLHVLETSSCFHIFVFFCAFLPCHPCLLPLLSCTISSSPVLMPRISTCLHTETDSDSIIERTCNTSNDSVLHEEDDYAIKWHYRYQPEAGTINHRPTVCRHPTSLCYHIITMQHWS